MSALYGSTETVPAVVHPRPGAVVIEFRGDQDLTTAEAVEKLLAGLISENDLIVVDVSEAEFIDSSFLHNLVKAQRLCEAEGKTMRLQHDTATVVRSALLSSGVLAVLDEASTREEALAPPG